MSSLQYSNVGGTPNQQGTDVMYSQAVIIGNIVKCAGQGGWENDSPENLPDDELQQLKNALKNVERILAGAGVKGGWESVYSVRSYHVSMKDSIGPFIELLKAHTPNHRPIATAVGVDKLAMPAMRIEIEVEAVLQ